MTERGFADRALDDTSVADIVERARRCRGAILTMTTLAASGHPGGSMSSLEIYLLLYHFARLRPSESAWPGRDRVFISHGHTSPGAYVALADAGFFELDDAVAHFRQVGSLFEGHVERSVPGIEWSSGNLGQGLSAGVGSAIASRLTGGGWHTFVAMSDGEQMKGQVGEARRLAARQRLGALTAVVDVNGIQISGHTRDVMPVDIAADFEADGWRVIHADGHDVQALHGALAQAHAETQRPCAVLARTVIGKGVSFMEDCSEYHGRGLTPDEYVRAMAELALDATYLERMRERRALPLSTGRAASQPAVTAKATAQPRIYGEQKITDNRSAWGTALADIATTDPDTPMAVLDCDLSVSVKTGAFAAVRPDSFVQCGVGEHNAAVVAGSLSANGVLTFWSDFGVFGCDEVYNQQRLNDLNDAHLKLALTHCGLDVGEDGKTHQCLDYVGAFRTFFGWKVIVPADPNQTDRAVRAMAATSGNIAICMGRSKLPVILDGGGAPLFGGDYRFEYGAIDWARRGGAVAVLTMGTVAGATVAAADLLAAEGIDIAVGVVSCPLDLDDDAMEIAVSLPALLTVEDHGVRTGLGASVAEWMALSGRATRFGRLGVAAYQSSGASKDLLAAAGLDTNGIAAAMRRAMSG